MDIYANTVATINPEARGSTLGLAFYDETPNIWEFTIDAGVGNAFARVGVVQTNPLSTGSGKSRWICWAHCPGAVAWRVSYRLVVGPPDAGAQLELSVSDSSIPAGITPNNAFVTVVP